MSGVPQDTNFSIVRGDAQSWTLSVAFPASAISTDLNTYDIKMTAKNSYSDLDVAAVFQLTTGNGAVSVDGQNTAIAHLTLASSNTSGLPCLPPLNVTTLVYDVQITGTDNRPFTVARGTITVAADATQVDS